MLRTLELAIALNAIPISVKDTMNSFFVELMLESFDAICSTNAPTKTQCVVQYKTTLSIYIFTSNKKQLSLESNEIS